MAKMVTTDVVQRAVMVTAQKKYLPKFKAGDTIEVHVVVKEGEKERVQLYRGIVLKIQGSGITRSFTVRKISDGIGVERTFPFTSPIVEKIDLIATGQVRRAKLYYLRRLEGKAAKVRSDLAMNQEINTADMSAEELTAHNAEIEKLAARKAEKAKAAKETKKAKPKPKK